MNRTFQTETDARKAITAYFSDRSAANGRKCAPKIKTGELDCDGEFFFKTFSCTYGTARMTLETYCVRVEIGN